MITLIQLEYLVAVDTYRHFATAAEKCFVTQPTLSMQLKKLEEYLEVILFDRSKQPVVPTVAGEKIIEQARVVLQESEKIKYLINDLKQDLKGELRIGVIPTIAPYLLPLFAGNLKNTHPNIFLRVEEAVTEQIENLLLKDLLDVGIVVTPLLHDQILEKHLYYEEMMIYHNEEHPLARQQVIKVDDINPKDIWLLSDGHCFRHQVINLCEIQEIESSELPFEFEGGSIETLMKIIDREGGYTLIPELAALEKKESNQVKQFSTIKPLREVSLVYTRKLAKIKIIEELAKIIQNAIPQHMLKADRGTLVEWR